MKTGTYKLRDSDSDEALVAVVETNLRIIQGPDVVFLTEKQARELHEALGELLGADHG